MNKYKKNCLNTTIVGSYTGRGAYLHPENSSNPTLLRCIRKHPTAKRSSEYLMIYSGGKTHYISSMYAVDSTATAYRIDYNGTNYVVTTTDTGVSISEAQD